MKICADEIMKMFGICEVTLRVWVSEGMPVLSPRGVAVRLTVADKFDVCKWVLSRKTDAKWSRQRHAEKFGFKRCSICGLTLSLDSFSKDLKKAAWKSNRCKFCDRKKCREYAARNRDKILARRTVRIAADQDKYKQISANVKRSSNGKARARLTNSVHKGLVKKPSACQECGVVVEKWRLEGHHDDYSRPLSVQWLCHKCHAAKSRKTSEPQLENIVDRDEIIKDLQ